METQRGIHRNLITPRRVLWTCLLLVHAAPLRAVCEDMAREARGHFTTGTLVRLLGLMALLSFFFLKMVDVAWLRLKPGWRSRLSATLVVALLHSGVVERILVGEAGVSPAQFGLVLSAAIATQGERARRRIGHWLTAGQATPTNDPSLKSLKCWGRVKSERCHTPPMHFLPAFARLRAPPFPA